MDFAQAVSVHRGRCFRWVYDDHGRPTTCPQAVIASGWLKVGERWHEIDACGEHSGELRFRGRLGTTPGRYRDATNPDASGWR